MKSLKRFARVAASAARRLRELGQDEAAREAARFGELTFSQEGEDLILRRLFEGRETSGFYVDVGAHHPVRFSNTYCFYRRGWRGINVDAMPGSMAAFNRLRPRDINIEIGVSESAGELTYYMFNEPALNGFSQELASQRDGLRTYRIIGTKQVPTAPLGEILKAHLPPGTVIDFLSIDVEGLDLQVLHSNDWKRFRPQFVLVESVQDDDWTAFEHSQQASFLAAQGYHLRCRTVYTGIFENTAGKRR